MTSGVPGRRGRGSDGFTLIEVTVVVVMVGLVAAVLAAVFTTVARTAPANVARADDARSLLGITTWLPQDVGSASPSSFVTGDVASGCSGVPTSRGLLELRWAEGGTTLVSNYRFVAEPAPNPDGLGTIIRYACRLGSTADALRMTAPLAPIPPAASPQPNAAPAPVDITLVGTPGDWRGLRFEITVLDSDGVTVRSLLALDAETQNIVTTLPPSTTVVGTTTTSSTTTTTTTAPNTPPTAPDYTTTASAGTPTTFTVVPTDPDPATTLTVTIVSAPPSWPAPTVSGFDITFTPDATGGGIDYRVSDGLATDDGRITVTIVPPASTTTTSTTTTTTTSTTTTTTTVPCSASIVSVNPSSVRVLPNGKLRDDVVVTISRSGSCIPLVLSFDPDTTDTNTTPQQLAFNAGTTVTIDKNAYTWARSGSRPWLFPLNLLEGANGNPAGTAEDTRNLTVTS